MTISGLAVNCRLHIVFLLGWVHIRSNMWGTGWRTCYLGELEGGKTQPGRDPSGILPLRKDHAIPTQDRVEALA